MSNSYDKNNDFVHHEDTEEESKDFFSEFPSSLCEVAFIFDPNSKEDLSNKSSYQIFRLFSSILKEKGQVLKVQKMLIDREINHRIEFINELPLRIYRAKQFPNDRFNYTEYKLKKLWTEKNPLDKFLENSTEIKKSLAFLSNKNEDVQTIREELYEIDILFFHNVIDILKLLLQKPQEFLYKSGGYKPNRSFPQNNKKKNAKKKEKIENLYIVCTILLDLSSECNLEQQSLKPFLEEMLSLRIANLKWENPENPVPSRYRYPLSNQEFIEIDPENFSFGLWDSDVPVPFFSPVWESANLNNSKSDIRMKKFVVRLDKKSEEIQEISLFFLVRKCEKTPEKDESRRFLIKIRLKPPSKVVVQRREGSIEFFLEHGREFPKCYFSEVKDRSFKNWQIKKNFHRIHNFLIDFKEIDELLLSYLRFKGGFSVLFTHSQTQCPEFKRFCQILVKNQIMTSYFQIDNPLRILEFIKIKPELTKPQFLNIKYLDFTTKYLLLVLDSMDKLKLSLQALHELEKLREFNPRTLELGLTDIAKSECIDLSIDNVVKQLEISMKMDIPNPSSCYNIMNVRKVLITTSGLVSYFMPEPIIEIGELSRYRKDYKLFLLAGFCDEDFSPISNQKLLLWGFYHDFLQSELLILDRPYDFLGFSAKMSQKSLFLLLARKEKLNANKILDNLFGNVSVLQEQVVYDPNCPLHYKNLIYFCQRMNNCLTQGLKLEDCLTKNLDLAYSELYQDVKIIISCKNEEDLCPNEISKGILKSLSERFHREISCLQVNFFGIRIKLMSSDKLPEPTIKVSRQIYESVFNEVFFLRMNQPLRFAELGEGQGLYFDSEQSFKGAQLQILDFSDVKLGYLNQNLIILLEYLEKTGQMEVSGYPDISNLLLKALKKLLEQLLAGNIDVNLLKDFDQLDLNATVLHENEDFFNFPAYFKAFLENKEKDQCFLNDIFWKMLSDTTLLAILSRLENKLEFSPFKNFYSLLYIKDPLGILKGNQAYLMLSRDSKREIITGKSLVFREFAVDFCEFHTITLVSNPSYQSYPNVLILSHDLMKEMNTLFPVPYSLSDRLMLINDPALNFPQDIIPKLETQSDLEATNKLIFQRLNERPIQSFVRLSNVANFFLNCVQEHSRKKSSYVQCILSNLNRNSKLFPTKEIGNKQWFLEYLNSVFANYLCQFELKKEQSAEKQFPDFIRGWMEDQENARNFLPSVNIAGTLYRDVVQVREKLVRKLHKGVTYEFKQTHFEDNFVISLEDLEIVKDVLEILSAYSREIGFLIEDLGAFNESEIFLGVLIEKSRFRQKKHLEKFNVLSQVGLANLFRKMVQSYRGKFLDFEDNKIKYAKYTYTVSYYFAGCFLKEANTEILTLLEDFDKENRVFLGLTWLVFASTLTEINSKKESPQKSSRV